MIIDVHCHYGYDRVFHYYTTEDELIKTINVNGVDVGIVQPLIPEAFAEPQEKVHDEIYELTKKYSKKIYGMASIHPLSGDEFYWKEARRTIENLGFVGLKFSPIGHAVHPHTPAGRLVFEASRVLKVPVMVHTGAGIPLALPTLLLPLAREFKEVPIVMAHSGSDLLAEEAIIVAKECDNIFLDTSWIGIGICNIFVKELGASRLMLASDEWRNQSIELFKWRSLGLKDEELEWVLGKTAETVYKIPR